MSFLLDVILHQNKSLDSEEYEDIIGFFDREELDFEPHSEWFKKNYSDYDLDITTVNKLEPYLKKLISRFSWELGAATVEKKIPVF